MKAFILAAGKGTRLRPLTDFIPKCLAPVGGERLLGRWFRLCRESGIKDILVNLHHFPQEVEEFIERSSSGLTIETFYEETLLGSAGTVRERRDFVKGERCFFIIYADNFSEIDLREMAEFHLKKNSVFTMALYRAENPRECGIAELKGDTVAAFSEKPLFPRSNLANAGIYAASAEVFRYIPPAGFADFGHDVLPKLAGRMKGYMMNCFHIDVGNPRNYAKANIKRWRERGVGEKP